MKQFINVLAIVGLASIAGAEEPPRRPAEVVSELLQVYGKKLDSVTYIPALAVQSRWQFGDLTDDDSQHERVRQLLGARRDRPKSHVEFAGHLVYAGVARTANGEQRDQAIEAVRRAADVLFDDQNQIRLPGPNEMSDAVFMVGPILCEAGSLTGEARYHDAALQYLTRMRRLRLREDDLYRHGHLCDAAWGRGNGFPAVGVAWCLTCLPAENAGREELLTAFHRHLRALAPHQTETGSWRQVIDVPEAYEEFSSTAMIGFAIQRGISAGWLDRAVWQPIVDLAWRSVCQRIEPAGKIIDVCEGTGTQKSLDDYLKRKAIRGVDDRGGAMALLFAMERLRAER